MSRAVDPDPEWYLDHVLLGAEPGGGRVGPARLRQAEWQRTWNELTESAGGDLAPAVRLAARQGFVLTRAQARDCGIADARVRSLIRTRAWCAPRRGILSPLPPTAGRTPSSTSPELRAAAAALSRAGCVISHGSAAIMHGLPVLVEPARPTLTIDRPTAVAGRSDVLVRGATVDAGERSTWFGAPVTALARTLIDVARLDGAAAGLVVADAALHETLVSPAALREALRGARRRPGVRRASVVVELASPLAESPLESLVRLCLHEGGVPAAELQVWLPTAAGRYRVDLLWPDRRVVLEADGASKYRRDPDALWREKRRQEALERAGYVVVRVTWADVLTDPDGTVARVLAALHRTPGPVRPDRAR